MYRIRPDSILLHINDAEDYLPPSVWLAACADDTTLYKAILNRESAAADAGVLETAVGSLASWVTSWHIAFKPTKSQALAISA